MLKKILGVLEKKQRKQFWFLSILDIVISVFDIFSLALLLWIIRFYIQPAPVNDIYFLPAAFADRNSVLLIAIFVLLFGIKNWLGFMVSRRQFKFINEIAISISRNNLVNYQESKFNEFINIDSSAHIRSIAFQPFDFSQYMLSGLQQIITQLSLILVTIIAIIIFNAKLFLLLLLILLPPVIVVFYFIKKRLTIAKKHIQASNESSFRYLLDALKGYVEANIYQRNHFFLERFLQSRKKFSKYLFNSFALQNLPNRIIEIFAVLGLFILIVIAKWTGSNDNYTLITIGAFVAAAYKIIPGIVKIINISGQMKAYEFSLETKPQNKNQKVLSAESKPVRIESIQFKSINFQYEGQPVLKNISFDIRKGDFIGIQGASGRGKTTILNLLLGFLQPTAGEILFNDQTMMTENIKIYWPSIAYVRQQNFFIHDSLLKNITFEEGGHNEENLSAALHASGLEKIISSSPDWAKKIITENGSNISGGQQQRISIARALYKNAQMILLDEPFNELDEASTQSLLEQFALLAKKGCLIVMISHDKTSLSFCNKIISLDEQ